MIKIFTQENMIVARDNVALGEYAFLKKFLKQHPELINQRYEPGSTLLSLACRNVESHIVELLLKEGENPSILNKNRTALQDITFVMFDTIQKEYPYFEKRKEDFYKIIELLLTKDKDENLGLLTKNFGTDEIKEHDFLSWVNNKLLEEHKDVAERIQQIVSKIVHGSPKPSASSGLSLATNIWSSFSSSVKLLFSAGEPQPSISDEGTEQNISPPHSKDD